MSSFECMVKKSVLILAPLLRLFVSVYDPLHVFHLVRITVPKKREKTSYIT